MQYSTGEIVKMIVANNHEGVYLNLVREGKMTAGLLPSVAEVAMALDHELSMYPDAAFLLRVLDVPVQTNHQFAAQLNSIRFDYGKSPVLVLKNQIETANAQAGSFEAISRAARQLPVASWVMLGLMAIGAVVVARVVFRLVAKAIFD